MKCVDLLCDFTVYENTWMDHSFSVSSHESICAVQKQRQQWQNCKHGKCKGLIPYAHDGGGAAGGNNADFVSIWGSDSCHCCRTLAAEKGNGYVPARIQPRCLEVLIRPITRDSLILCRAALLMMQRISDCDMHLVGVISL